MLLVAFSHKEKASTAPTAAPADRQLGPTDAQTTQKRTHPMAQQATTPDALRAGSSGRRSRDPNGKQLRATPAASATAAADGLLGPAHAQMKQSPPAPRPSGRRWPHALCKREGAGGFPGPRGGTTKCHTGGGGLRRGGCAWEAATTKEMAWPPCAVCQGNPCSTSIRWGVSPAAQMGCLRNRSGSPSGADQP